MSDKAVLISNAYYNRGLEKARVRDLSGARESLKISIAINKYNIDARNLLGLIYCEMGEVVEALSQWVISKNLQAKDNVAGRYISTVQSNQAKFESVTNNIKKYNIALRYVYEDNIDMATIQLKKVVSTNPHMLKAQLLLALLYIKDGDYAKARKPIAMVLRYDKNNTLALRYMAETEAQLKQKNKDSSTRVGVRKKYEPEVDRPLSGNDVIVPRSSYKEPSNGAITAVNILVGMVVGAALIWFLITPARYKGLTAEYNNSIREYSEQLSANNVEINQLNDELENIRKQKNTLEMKLSEVSGSDGNNKLLTAVITAANQYIANDTTAAAEALVDVDVSKLPVDEAKTLYNKISGATMNSAAQDLHDRGMSSYNKKDYTAAADYFARSYKCDKTRGDSVYYAAKSYIALKDTENAKKYYQIIVDNFKSSGYFAEAKTYVETK